MFAMSRFQFRDMVRHGMEEKWKEIDKKWFCTRDTTKVPGLLKISIWILFYSTYELFLSGKRNFVWVIHWTLTKMLYSGRWKWLQKVRTFTSFQILRDKLKVHERLSKQNQNRQTVFWKMSLWQRLPPYGVLPQIATYKNEVDDVFDQSAKARAESDIYKVFCRTE